MVADILGFGLEGLTTGCVTDSERLYDPAKPLFLEVINLEGRPTTGREQSTQQAVSIELNIDEGTHRGIASIMGRGEAPHESVPF